MFGIFRRGRGKKEFAAIKIMLNKVAKLMVSGMEPEAMVKKLIVEDGFPLHNAQNLVDLTIVITRTVAEEQELRPLSFPIKEIMKNFKLSEKQVDELKEISGKVLDQALSEADIKDRKEENPSFQKAHDALSESMENYNDEALAGTLVFFNKISSLLDRNVPARMVSQMLQKEDNFPEDLAGNLVDDSIAIKKVLKGFKYGKDPVAVMESLGFAERPPYASMMTLHLLEEARKA